jgi:hypothetical protein
MSRPLSKARREVFLDAIRSGHTVRRACDIAEITPSWYVRERQRNPEFAAAYDEAKELGVQAIEQVAIDLALGKQRPVHYRGEVVDHVDEYSERMIELLLKARRPELYGDRQRIDHATPDGRPFPMALTFDPDKLSDDELAQLETILEKARPEQQP